MACFSCIGVLGAVSRAMAKSAASKFRSLGALPVYRDWASRATLCERCPLRIIHQGASYCGRPFLHHPRRDNSIDGCGCPTHAKAKAPNEHCPLDQLNRPARLDAARCTCKWCALNQKPEVRIPNQ